ncbi:MAG: hypothetical protein PHS31_04125, partial [Victivallaceae bacterium]|nr:hypothetical protein [Victivallaceae bacterium]
PSTPSGWGRMASPSAPSLPDPRPIAPPADSPLPPHNRKPPCNITDTRYRAGYQLYLDKPGLNENSEESKIALEKSIYAIGETIGYDQWGNSKHFYQRTGKK